jgi:predicted dehydrogenase
MRPLNRRAFLSSAAAASLMVPRQVLGAGKTSPNEKLNIAGIGIGGMGGGNLRNLGQENIVALCDVDSDYAAKTFATYPDAKRYVDYREMLVKETDIDGVVIATPDHTHAMIAKAAMEAGKHVYCQKPLTHTVHEARTLAETAKKTGVVTQMGIQGHSMRGIREVKEWIAAGVIGEVREVEAWCDLTYYPWGHASWSSPVGTRPEETPAIPDTLDWEIWEGPAPHRPYHPCYHPRTWRSWWDYGCGMMGDRGAHTFDPIFWALDLGQPTIIEASSTDLNPETHPIACLVTYEFPARGDKPPVTLTWYDGMRPPRPKEIDRKETLGDGEGGVLFKGSDGYLTCGTYGQSPRLLPESRMKAFTPPAETIARVKGSHEDDWCRAIREGGQSGADFSYSGPLTEICLLGNIAKRLDTKIEWDTDALEVTNHDGAKDLVTKAYRDGWRL